MSYSFLICSMGRSGTSLLKFLIGTQGIEPPRAFKPNDPIEDMESLCMTVWLRNIKEDIVVRCRAKLNISMHLTDAEVLDTVFPGIKYIYLLRKNIVRQAISYVKAKQSGQWWLLKRDIPFTHDFTYDPVAISHEMTKIFKYRQMWEDWFKSNKINPLRITYEDCVENPKPTLENIIDFLGLTVPFSADRMRKGFQSKNAPQKQADKLTDDYEIAFKRELYLV